MAIVHEDQPCDPVSLLSNQTLFLFPIMQGAGLHLSLEDLYASLNDAPANSTSSESVCTAPDASLAAYVASGTETTAHRGTPWKFSCWHECSACGKPCGADFQNKHDWKVLGMLC